MASTPTAPVIDHLSLGASRVRRQNARSNNSHRTIWTPLKTGPGPGSAALGQAQKAAPLYGIVCRHSGTVPLLASSSRRIATRLGSASPMIR
jgi:hypothetical protein